MPLRLTVILFVVISMAACSDEDSLKPFTTDGCSAFPDGTLEHRELWLVCCTAHDLAYWQGGTSAERQQADQALHSCVARSGESEIAALMLAGVRAGGSPYFPTQFRWGYGWPYPRGYKALSDKEQERIRLAFYGTQSHD